MNIKRFSAVILSVLLLLALAACGASSGQQSSGQAQSAPAAEKDITKEPSPEDATEIKPHITVYAADDSLIFLSTVTDLYAGYRPAMTTAVLFDESVVLTEKILSGYDCDIFITDEPFYMDYIDKNGGKTNQYGLDLLVEGSRTVLFTVPDPEGGESKDFTAAILNQSVCPLDCQQFLDWVRDLDDSVYEECGAAKP